MTLSSPLTNKNKTKEGEWPKKQLKGTELYGKTLGFVGCGRIGAEVVTRAHAFGMKCLVYDPYLPPEVFKKLQIAFAFLYST